MSALHELQKHKNGLMRTIHGHKDSFDQQTTLLSQGGLRSIAEQENTDCPVRNFSLNFEFRLMIILRMGKMISIDLTLKVGVVFVRFCSKEN